MTRILVALGLAALFAGGALAASNVPKLPILAAAEKKKTTSTATTTGGTTTSASTGTTTGSTTGTTTGGTTTGTTGTGTTGTTTGGTTSTGTSTTAAEGQEGVREGKVRVCHVTGSKKNPGVEIEVSENALPAHMGHGDEEGECEGEREPEH